MKNLSLALLTLLSLAGSSSLRAQETWTPEKQMSFKNIQDTEISDDGKYVAYVVRTPVMEGEKSEYNSQIWVAATDGSFNFQYTRGEKSSTQPKFSPDSQKLAFVSSRSGKSQVWTIRLMGGEPIQITDEKEGVGGFEWAPDGETIIFTKTDEPTEEEEKARKEKRDVILVDKNYKFQHLYSVAASGEGDKTAKQLTDGEIVINSFDISPDGKEIVFSYSYEPTINSGFIETDIARVSADSGAVEVLVKRPGNDDNPIYSPDGKTIAFTTTNGEPMPIGLSDISLLNIKSGKITPLPKTPDRSAGLVDWSGDGSKIYFQEAFHTTRSMMAIDIASSKKSPEQLIVEESSWVSDPSGVATGFDLSPNGRASFVFQNPNTPPEVFVKDLSSNELVQLSHINDTNEVPEMGRSEILTWKSKDGLEVEGILTYPVGYEKGKSYPIILNVHGGPAGVFSNFFTGGASIYMIQYFAQKGYAILRPNPRGSTGYGKDFRFANFKDWGYGDFDDLVTGVDKVIEMGIGDENNQFLMGWSYGGYMTSFAVTRTDRFNAASMGAGLPNLVSMVSTTDIPDYLVAHMGEEFWNDYETYEKHSAIYNIKNVKTPTQVIHGQNDLRVPFTQGQEFYVALKRLGVDTEMIVYPRTPHGPREPKFLMDVSDRILTWFENYRK